MKNWLLALLGSEVRAMPSVPRTNGSFENSAGRSGLSEPPRAGAGGIAGLRHEPGDHPVEDDPVVEALAGQLLDARHVLGREVGAQLDHHAAALEIYVQHVFQILSVGGAADEQGGDDGRKGACKTAQGRWLLQVAIRARQRPCGLRALHTL